MHCRWLGPAHRPATANACPQLQRLPCLHARGIPSECAPELPNVVGGGYSSLRAAGTHALPRLTSNAAARQGGPQRVHCTPLPPPPVRTRRTRSRGEALTGGRRRGQSRRGTRGGTRRGRPPSRSGSCRGGKTWVCVCVSQVKSSRVCGGASSGCEGRGEARESDGSAAAASSAADWHSGSRQASSRHEQRGGSAASSCAQSSQQPRRSGSPLAVAEAAGRAVAAGRAGTLTLQGAGALLEGGGHDLGGQVQELAQVLNARVGQEPARRRRAERRGGRCRAANAPFLCVHTTPRLPTPSPPAAHQ